MAGRPKRRQPPPVDLRECILADFQALKVPLRPEAFDAVRARVEHDGLSHLEFCTC